MSDEQIQAELVDDEIQAEPVLDEFTLAKLAEAAEAEDRRIRAVRPVPRVVARGSGVCRTRLPLASPSKGFRTGQIPIE